MRLHSVCFEEEEMTRICSEILGGKIHSEILGGKIHNEALEERIHNEVRIEMIQTQWSFILVNRNYREGMNHRLQYDSFYLSHDG